MAKDYKKYKLDWLQRFIVSLGVWAAFLGGIVFIGAGVFILNDDRQPNPTTDGVIAITIGVLMLLVLVPLMRHLTKKALDLDKKARDQE